MSLLTSLFPLVTTNLVFYVCESVLVLAYMHSFVLFFKFYVYIISCSICLSSLSSLSHQSRCGALHLSSLYTYGKRAKTHETGVGASDWVEKDEDSPFLRICYLVTVLVLETEKGFRCIHEAPNSKHHPEIPEVL